MFEWFSSLSIELRISLISTIATILISMVSIFIAVASLIQNSKVIKSSNRPSVVIFLESISLTGMRHKYLVVKNFGNTPAKIDSITCSIPIDFCCGLDPFTKLNNSTIAPNQSISTICTLDSISCDFYFEINYSYENRKFTETCFISPRSTEDLLSTHDKSKHKSDIEKTIINTAEEFIKSTF